MAPGAAAVFWRFVRTFSTLKAEAVSDPERVDLPMVLVPHPHVRVDANVLGGSPYVVGSRVPVRRLWAFYRKGITIDTLLRRFPRLGAAKIFDALAFAYDNEEVMIADLEREEQLLDRVESGKKGDAPAARQMDLPFSE
jgi:uncharacterized protein (DUF433 family)